MMKTVILGARHPHSQADVSSSSRVRRVARAPNTRVRRHETSRARVRLTWRTRYVARGRSITHGDPCRSPKR